MLPHHPRSAGQGSGVRAALVAGVPGSPPAARDRDFVGLRSLVPLGGGRPGPQPAPGGLPSARVPRTKAPWGCAAPLPVPEGLAGPDSRRHPVAVRIMPEAGDAARARGDGRPGGPGPQAGWRRDVHDAECAGALCMFGLGTRPRVRGGSRGPGGALGPVAAVLTVGPASGGWLRCGTPHRPWPGDCGKRWRPGVLRGGWLGTWAAS